MMMTAVLLMMALTVKAQYSGTQESPNKKLMMSFTISGGTIIDKGKAGSGIQTIKCTATPGTTISSSATRIKGPTKPDSDGKGPIQVFYTSFDKQGKPVSHDLNHNPKTTSLSYKIPKGIARVEFRCYYPTDSDGTLMAIITWEVSENATPTTDSSTLSDYKGTMDFLGTEMEYAITNGIITSKKVNPLGSNSMELKIKGQTLAGSTVSATFKKVAECLTTNNKVNVSIQAETTDGKSTYLQEKSGKESATASAQVPKNAKKIVIIMSYQWGMGYISCFVEWDVVKNLTAAKDKYFKWDDFSNDNYCDYCGNQYSYYRISKVTDDANRVIDEGDVHIYCSSEPKKSRRKARPALGVIYYKDYIVTGSYTTAVLDKCDKKGVITIMENSVVLLNKRLSNGKDHWKIEKGRVVGNNLKGAECEFEMSACTAKPTGTTYVLEDDGKTSRVYLLQGSMEVTSKKGSKKSTLKPGQAAAVSNQGQISVSTFDVGAMAKKYKISGVSSTATTNRDKTTHTKSDRYNVKCAIVKYKFTKGKVTGEHDRVFDNYGKLERRSFKTPTEETVAYYRDKKVYTLDLKKKTMKEEKDNELNFGNPDDPVLKKKLQNGSSTILGKKCAIYRSGQIDYYVWKGIVLKKVSHQKDGSTAIYEATSLTLPDSLDPTIFVVPMGYKKK